MKNNLGILWVIAASSFSFFCGFLTGLGDEKRSEAKHREQLEVSNFAAYHQGFTDAFRENNAETHRYFYIGSNLYKVVEVRTPLITKTNGGTNGR